MDPWAWAEMVIKDFRPFTPEEIALAGRYAAEADADIRAAEDG